MITTEQWLLEVAEQSQLAQTTCQQLWSDLTSLLIGRLTQGSSTYMRSVGLWSAESHNAFIALLPSGERYLMPPRVATTASVSLLSLEGKGGGVTTTASGSLLSLEGEGGGVAEVSAWG